MQVLGCAQPITPCPAPDQVWVQLSEAIDYADLGLTAESLEKAFMFGFGAVLMFFLIGYTAGVVIGLVKKL